MAVQVTKETDSELLKYGVEDCVKCEQKTLYWWAGGCMPLCPGCAKLVTRDWCLSHAKWNKYGPLPATQYRNRRKEKVSA